MVVSRFFPFCFFGLCQTLTYLFPENKSKPSHEAGHTLTSVLKGSKWFINMNRILAILLQFCKIIVSSFVDQKSKLKIIYFLPS